MDPVFSYRILLVSHILTDMKTKPETQRARVKLSPVYYLFPPNPVHILIESYTFHTQSQFEL